MRAPILAAEATLSQPVIIYFEFNYLVVLCISNKQLTCDWSEGYLECYNSNSGSVVREMVVSMVQASVYIISMVHACHVQLYTSDGGSAAQSQQVQVSVYQSMKNYHNRSGSMLLAVDGFAKISCEIRFTESLGNSWVGVADSGNILT
jgi:hypothetical protein